MDRDTGIAVRDELVRRGVPAEYEYPGHITVFVGKDTELILNDCNDHIFVEVVVSGEHEHRENIDSDMMPNCTDVKRIADFFATAYTQAMEVAGFKLIGRIMEVDHPKHADYIFPDGNVLVVPSDNTFDADTYGCLDDLVASIATGYRYESLTSEGNACLCGAPLPEGMKACDTCAGRRLPGLDDLVCDKCDRHIGWVNELDLNGSKFYCDTCAHPPAAVTEAA